MSIKKFSISKDPNLYHGWPDVTLTPSGKLICVFSECTHHSNRDYTRVMLTESSDRGRTWSRKHPLTEGTKGLKYFYNCARIMTLPDGRLVITIDKVPREGEVHDNDSIVYLYISADEGNTWSDPVETPLRGIVPDKLSVVNNGRWIIAAHRKMDGMLTEVLRYSDDQGKTWSPEVTAAHDLRFQLCEGSLLNTGDGILVMFLRENSGIGLDCKKTISKDNGKTWGPVIDFPLPACHRPSAGLLNDGRVLITYRMMQGGNGWLGSWTQNLFAGLSNLESVRAEQRRDAAVRILPIDFDRSPFSDTGYSGWVQFPDGEIYIVNYIVDDAYDKAQIRGYSLTIDDFLISKNT